MFCLPVIKCNGQCTTPLASTFCPLITQLIPTPAWGSAVGQSTAYPKESESPRNAISRAKGKYICLRERVSLRFEKAFCDFFERIGEDIT